MCACVCVIEMGFLVTGYICGISSCVWVVDEIYAGNFVNKQLFRICLYKKYQRQHKVCLRECLCVCVCVCVCVLCVSVSMSFMLG